MKGQKNGINRSKLLKIVNDITLTAKERNLIKPVKEAFKDVPTSKEVHKGNRDYFVD